MEKQIARQFRQKVQALLEDESERDTLYTSLREYHESMSLSELITDLRKVVNSPDRMELFEDVRPLIPLKHQVEYDKIVPNRLAKARIVKLVKNGPDSLGFSLRGGVEHGVGIYVAHVVPSSPAEISGLRVGDEVLRINGYSVNESTHEEIVLLTQSTNYIEMKIRHIGMLPIKRTRTDQLRWEYVHPVPGSPESPNGTVLGEVINNMSNGAPSPKMGKEDRRVFVNLEGTPGLGCSICGGPAYKPGVFVKNVKPGSIAEEIGLKLGDQFLDVNGINLTHADYGEAISALKGSKQLTITVRPQEGEELFKDNIIPKKSIHLDNESQPQDSEEKRAEREELERLRQIAVDREKKRQKKETEEREAEEKKKQEEEQQSKLQKRKSEEDDEEISRQLEQELLNLSLTQQKLDDEKKQEESRKHQESRTQAQRRESERKEKQTRQELDRLSEHDKKRRKELELQQKLEEQNRLQQEKEERMRIHRLQQEAKESEREIQREQQWLSQEAEKDLRKPNLIPSPPKTYMSPSAAQGVRN
ncbi:USH1C [Branchiostoma lanceolatum]|uniref:USH1C protein n=1 Tax=Branchiostoma lanceolatum TaxID=7740 RepID=A0A8K0ES66_BRALA|nr:USH1C [Branchiostoma lanceolatum]